MTDIASKKISFISIESGSKKMYDVYVELFPLHLKPHRSTTKLEAIQGLKLELLDVLKGVDREIELLQKQQVYYITEIDVKSNVMKQKEVTIVKSGSRYKLFGYWGNKPNEHIIVKQLNAWCKSGSGFSNIFRKVSENKPAKDAVMKELNACLKHNKKWISVTKQCKLI